MPVKGLRQRDARVMHADVTISVLVFHCQHLHVQKRSASTVWRNVLLARLIRDTACGMRYQGPTCRGHQIWV